MNQSPKRALSADANFRRFWFGQAASTTGDAFGFVAMPLLVLAVTGSIVQMGVVTAIAAGGQLVAGLASGVVVDRVHRRHLMIACDIGRMLCYLALPVFWWAGLPDVRVIYVVAALVSLLSSLFLVAYMTAVANIVELEAVPAANGRLQATQALTYVLGSMLAGAVCTAFGPATAIGVDALSFGASAFSLSRVHFRQDRAVADSSTHGGGALKEIAIGFRFLFSEPILRALLYFQMAIALFASIGLSAAVIDLIVFRLRTELHESGRGVGVSLGCAAAGAVLGALGSAKLRRRLSFGAIIVFGTAVQGAGLLLSGLGFGIATITAGAVAWAAGLTLRSVAATSLRQLRTPDALLGRVTAAGWTMIFGLGALGALLVTQLAAALGTSNALRDLGLGLAAISALAGLSPLVRPHAPLPIAGPSGERRTS